MNSYAPASLIRRLAAFLYDSLLLIALFMLLTAIAVRLNDGEAIEHLAYKFALLPIAWFFFAWFWSKSGQTLGMQAWRIKMTNNCLLYTSPSPRDATLSRMPSSA